MILRFDITSTVMNTRDRQFDELHEPRKLNEKKSLKMFFHRTDQLNCVYHNSEAYLKGNLNSVKAMCQWNRLLIYMYQQNRQWFNFKYLGNFTTLSRCI